MEDKQKYRRMGRSAENTPEMRVVAIKCKPGPDAEAYIAWHSVSNLYCVMAPALGGVSARDFIVELSGFVEVVATGTEEVRYAAELPMGDFEDAMQVAAARACGARHIVTRNVGDYERSPIRAVDPREALGALF